MLLSPAFTLIVSANELTDSTSQPSNSQSNNSSTIVHTYIETDENGKTVSKSTPIEILNGTALVINQSGNYQLTEDTNCSIIVGSEEGTENLSVTLDLGSYTLTNADNQHTVTVHKGASLIIQGNGTVDNVSSGKAAVYNKGSVELLGGTYSRSAEKKGNSYYTITNHGVMKIGSNEEESNVTVMHADKNGTTTKSSLVKNGGNTPSSSNDYSDYPSSLTIYNGNFYGGTAAIKNDFNGTLDIKGGEIRGYLVALQNWHIAEISGGKFGLSKNNKIPEINVRAGGVIENLAYQKKDGTYEELGKGNLKITGSTSITTEESTGDRVCLTNHLYCLLPDIQDYIPPTPDQMTANNVNQFSVSPSVKFQGKVTIEDNEGLIDFQEPTVTKPSTNKPAVSQKVQDMHRLYNPNSGEHFYTANLGEKHHLVSLGWVDEGVGWTAPAKSNTPVYRLYNPNAGDHHYTLNREERDYLVAAGWNDEGIGFYSDDKESAPLYRSYNPNAVTGSHNYTLNKAEHQYLTSIGWRDEAIAWYGTK